MHGEKCRRVGFLARQANAFACYNFGKQQEQGDTGQRGQTTGTQYYDPDRAKLQQELAQQMGGPDNQTGAQAYNTGYGTEENPYMPGPPQPGTNRDPHNTTGVGGGWQPREGPIVQQKDQTPPPTLPPPQIPNLPPSPPGPNPQQNPQPENPGYMPGINMAGGEQIQRGAAATGNQAGMAAAMREPNTAAPYPYTLPGIDMPGTYQTSTDERLPLSPPGRGRPPTTTIQAPIGGGRNPYSNPQVVPRGEQYSWGAGGAAGNRQEASGHAFYGLSDIANNPISQGTRNAMTQEALNAANAKTAGAGEQIQRGAAATGNQAGMAAAMAQLGRDRAGIGEQAGRENVIAQDTMATGRRMGALSGLSGLAGQQSQDYNAAMASRGQLAGQSVGQASDLASQGKFRKNTTGSGLFIG